jgi:hypothetical protein
VTAVTNKRDGRHRSVGKRSATQQTQQEAVAWQHLSSMLIRNKNRLKMPTPQLFHKSWGVVLPELRLFINLKQLKPKSIYLNLNLKT